MKPHKRQYRPTFYCHNCRQTCASNPPGSITPGYGVTRAGNKVCYACCAKVDARAMARTGRAVLYLTIDKYGAATVTNWPGSLTMRAFAHKGRHNIARAQYNVTFTGPDGAKWYGRQVGDDNTVCRCRRAKVA